MTPDLAARRVIMASMLYYGLDESLIPDAEFDRLCTLAADNWGQLHPDRQWALGSPDEIRASGFHVKVSSMAESAAVAWLEREGRMGGRSIQRTVRQRPTKGPGGWNRCSEYRWTS